MTVKEFIKEYKKSTEIKDVIKCTYLSFAKKCNMCERIIKSTYYTKTVDEMKKLHINSTAKYMLFNLSIVDAYTHLEINFDKSIEEYDLLTENGLIDIIKAELLDKELCELETILEMTANDVIQNEYETHAFISNQVERFGTLLGVSLSPALEKLSEVIVGLDDEKIAKILGQVDKLDKNKILKLFK